MQVARRLAILASSCLVLSSCGKQAVHVEEVIPSQPFFTSMFVNSLAYSAAGPGAGVLAVSNLTITNFTPSIVQLLIMNPLTTGGACSTTTVQGPSGGVLIDVLVQPQSTLVIPYPQPWIFKPVAGNTCIAAIALTYPVPGGVVGVLIAVTGFVN